MRTIRSFLTLAAFLFLALAAAPGVAPSASAAQSGPAATSSCVNHLFGSGSVTGGKQITFRARLGAPAPAGGVVVLLSSDSAAIPIQGKVIIPEGSQELTFYSATNPVVTTEVATVTATTGDCSASKSVTIKEPVLRSLSVQSVMRSDGLGKVTVCLTGRAAEDIAVDMTTDNESALPAAAFVIPAGKACVSYKADVGSVVDPTAVSVIVTVKGASLSGSTTVRVFEDL